MLHDKTISHSQKIGSVTSHQKYVTGNAIIMSLKNQPITCQEISVTSVYCNSCMYMCIYHAQKFFIHLFGSSCMLG